MYFFEPDVTAATAKVVLTKTKGIVLRKMKYSETSIIADVLTEQFGRLSYIISGVRSAKARTSAAVLELLSIVDMVAYHSERSTLHRIREIKPAYLFQSVPFDVRKNAMILFMAELCAKTVRETEPNPALFACIESALIELDTAKEGYADLHVVFMIALADQLGFGPAADYTPDRPGFDLLGGSFVDRQPEHQYFVLDGSLLARVIQCSRGLSAHPDLNRVERNRVIDDLLLYYQLHIDNMPEIQSHRVLREIL